MSRFGLKPDERVEDDLSQMGVVIVLLTDSTIRSTLLPAFTTG